jgi:phage baseplate assembly protein W
MAKKQFYGIKYPFISQDEENYFLDLNKDIKSKIKSLLIHVVFTPKGQKIRDPEFGTNLIKFIFDPDDGETWENIKEEIRKQISFYLPQVTFNNININHATDDDEEGLFVELDYTVAKNGTETQNKVLVKI